MRTLQRSNTWSVVDFPELMAAVRGQRNLRLPDPRNPLCVLCIDPGHTTGIARFMDSGELLSVDQVDTSDPNEPNDTLLHDIRDWADLIVMEEYRVYTWRAKHHGGSDLLTSRVIGGIELFNSIGRRVPLIKQPAHVAKGFVKDRKLEEWGFYQRGKKHANDAVRHGCYFLLFNKGNWDERTQRSQVG